MIPKVTALNGRRSARPGPTSGGTGRRGDRCRGTRRPRRRARRRDSAATAPFGAFLDAEAVPALFLRTGIVFPVVAPCLPVEGVGPVCGNRIAPRHVTDLTLDRALAPRGHRLETVVVAEVGVGEPALLEHRLAGQSRVLRIRAIIGLNVDPVVLCAADDGCSTTPVETYHLGQDAETHDRPRAHLRCRAEGQAVDRNHRATGALDSLRGPAEQARAERCRDGQDHCGSPGVLRNICSISMVESKGVSPLELPKND